MKKLWIAIIAMLLVISGIPAQQAKAAEPNTLETVKQLENGQRSLDGVKIGMRIQDVLKKNDKPMYSKRPDGKEHYYEFNKKDVTLIVTVKSNKKNTGRVTAVSMSFNDVSGPMYKDVVRVVDKRAKKHKSYSKYMGSSAYIEGKHVGYQFGSQSPKEKQPKLYRIDIH